ncbi:MAG: ABC transporter permease, partial [Candidatus Hydrogenedentes bacterium]|nr:ABC transporter permease [Candidatus Hydrogenedentota bacterium]
MNRTVHDSEWMQAWRQLRKRKMSVIGLVIIICLVLAAAFAPVLAPQGPFTQNVSRANISQPPSFAHGLGTDRLGRDVYSRIVYGARISLQVGIIAEIVTLCIGIVIG